MTKAQEKAATFLALGIVMALSAWLIIVTVLVNLKWLDARQGLGWMLAAAISTSADMSLMFGGIATIVVAGLAAAGAVRKPGAFTYATGIAVILALIAVLLLHWMLQDRNFESEIRGTTEFANIQGGLAFRAASAAFAKSMAVALAAALAALLGISLRKGQAA